MSTVCGVIWELWGVYADVSVQGVGNSKEKTTLRRATGADLSRPSDAATTFNEAGEDQTLNPHP